MDSKSFLSCLISKTCRDEVLTISGGNKFVVDDSEREEVGWCNISAFSSLYLRPLVVSYIHFQQTAQKDISLGSVHTKSSKRLVS